MGACGFIWRVPPKRSFGALEGNRAATKGDEISRDIRPYLKVYFPVHVLDWQFEESGSGCYELTYLKVRERVDGGSGSDNSGSSGWVYRVWSRERVEVWRVDGRDDDAVLVSEG